MKKNLIIIFIFLIALPAVVFAASHTQNGSLNITGTVPGGSTGCTVDCNPPETTSTPTSTFSIVQVASAPLCGSAGISWQTTLTTSGVVSPVSATGYVEYWPENSESQKARVNTGSSNSSQLVNLDNLSPLTRYGFSIHAQTGSYSDDSAGSFRTNCVLPSPGLSIVPRSDALDLHITYPNYSDIVRLAVYHGQATCEGNNFFYESRENKTPSSTETVTGNTGISLNRTYDYTVCIYNSIGESASAYASYRRDVAEVSNASAVPGNRQVVLSWNNPANNPADDFTVSAVRLIRVTGNCNSATGINDGTVLREAAFENFTDINLTNRVVYRYKIFVKNSYGQYSPGVCLSATPSAPAEARCILGIGYNVVSGGQVNFNWSNPLNEPDVFQLHQTRWQRGTACADNSASGQNVYSGLGQSFTNIVNLGHVYFYSAFVNYNDNQIISCGCWPVDVPPDIVETTGTPPVVCVDCTTSDKSPVSSFFVNDGALPLVATSDRQISVLAGQPIIVRVPTVGLPKAVSTIMVSINGNNYFLSQDNAQGYYQALFQSPGAGKYMLWLSTTYNDATVNQSPWEFVVVPRGVVRDDNDKNLSGVAISLMQGAGLFSSAGLNNPQSLEGNGAYGFMVPNGAYRVVVKRGEGVVYQSGVINVTNNIISYDIDITKQKILENILQTALPQEAQKAVAAVAKNVSQIVAKPEVQTANQVAAPAIATVATVNVIVAVPWWNFWYYLQYLFTEFVPWLLVRKRKGWGVVYNSITKKPIDLAVVRLYDAKSNQLLKTKITDRRGRYMFLVEAGSYYLKVSKPNFEFPSQLLKNASYDKEYVDIYHGEPINISSGEKGAIIANIPLDQEELKITDAQILRNYFWNGLRKNLSLVGPILSFVALAVSPSWLMLGLCIFHIVLLLLFNRLAKKGKVKYWGVVYDANNKKPLSRAIARIFSPEYNRMLEAYVTDRQGRYGFLAGSNVYYITGEKPGYATYKTENIDLSHSGAGDMVGRDLPLSVEAVGKSESVDKAVSDNQTPDESSPAVVAKALEDNKAVEPELKPQEMGEPSIINKASIANNNDKIVEAPKVEIAPVKSEVVSSIDLDDVKGEGIYG